MRIGLVGCVKTKRTTGAPARDLYTSTLFAGRRRYVEQSSDRWFVLSALHGLVRDDEWLEPYRAHWAGRLDALEQHLARTAIPVERPRPTDLTDHPTTEDQP